MSRSCGRLVASALCVLAVGLWGGCEPPGSRPISVTDSAGIRVVLSADGARTYVRVSEAPALDLGGADASGPFQFSNLRGVHLAGDGGLWVVDGASREVRIFDADGAHRRTLGGPGEGPGEFLRPRLLGGVVGDSVAVWDDRSARLTLLPAEGEVGRLATHSPGEDRPIQGLAVFQDGSVLGRTPAVYPAAALAPGRLLKDSARLVRVDLEASTTEPVARTTGASWIWTGRSQVPLPFTADPAFAVQGESVRLASGPRFRVEVIRNGRLVEVHGVERDPRRVSEEHIRAYADFYGSAISDRTLGREYTEALEHPERPDVLPAYSDLVVAPDGGTWAALYAPAPAGGTIWDVYAPDGAWLGQVRTPTGFELEVVGEDRLFGVWRDTLGVEHLRAYGLVRER